jgi:hypothetical protein
MGTLTYDGAVLEFDDRLLTHLHVVIMQKFRRGQSFPMSWLDPLSAGNGRSSVWLTPSLPVFFQFESTRVPPISQLWLDRLMQSADGARGLVVLNEDGSAAHATALVRRPDRVHA